MSSWALNYDGWQPEQEGLREALCTLGNAYFATRGAGEESEANDIHYPGTYLAGCYDRLSSQVAGRTVENEDLVNLPNWLPLRFRIERGPWFHPGHVELLHYRQRLDLRQGILRRRIRFRDAAGRICRVESRRLVHASAIHLAAQEITVTAENWSGIVEFQSALDGRIVNAGVERYRALNGNHLRPLATTAEHGQPLVLEVETRASHIRLAQAARTRLFHNGSETATRGTNTSQPGYVAAHFRVRLSKGEQVRAEKVIAIYSARDRAISAPALEAKEAVRTAGDFASLLRSHARAWTQLWRRFDLELKLRSCPGNTECMRLLRLHIYHLLAVASPNLQHVDAGIPARGLHGEAYRGHVFWDELFILPTLTYRMPEVTLAALMYRWYRLDRARQEARTVGYKGALYPWQSGSNGREETQHMHLNPQSGRWLPDNSHRQRHVSLAIAYNIWHYYETTDDHEFMLAYGSEMLLEIARFWADLAKYNPVNGRYEIKGVMGPDEFHEGYPEDNPPRGIDNNAYTNVMASWVLRQALTLLEQLPQEVNKTLRAQLDLEENELAHWKSVSRRLRVDFHNGRIISQFQGYESLAEFEWKTYRERYGDIHRLDRILEAEGDTPNRYKLSKQADVLMLFYLFSAEQLQENFAYLGYVFESEWIPDNVAYYQARTSHGSSLSRVVHAWVLSRTHRAQSWDLFQESLRTDYNGTAGSTTREGIHLGAMAGTIDLIFRCYTGLEVRDEALWLKPQLPHEVDRLCMHLTFRGRTLHLVFEKNQLSVQVGGHTEGVFVGVQDTLHRILPGERKVFQLPRRQAD
ncbi:trehalose 6-phosphate phosphorylase [Alkalilimnicola ehrlichii]|uniref:Trehalose 6-phosphate phosphorylase n=1 Tax=Alkalilimnicola ehrlichii TaxID=351052 RepID=A0A3E0X1N3_9GAMM|nr:glycosyl hydrolase family 65 protein [Alkalilimnicola ehrlichii]RFA30763.1 trehalose 6-phosphate phosphorylase [Alkalilimnicola ehrlichii]RFA38339.1 trehalose 6-phosphate phosphorylase [Alkalilimnicola ehrlichii]